ncbi:hypothetical protein [Synechococcus sp. MIT S9452]|uniref:hypothetical protein n=1 Tax=Synechococcus sp. MIT S9452 TaxID=3082546 RepID=UPI0039A512ED
MSKFLLRDGSKISVNTLADPADVWSYTTLDGVTVHALLSAKAESRLLQKVPSSLLTVPQRMQLLGQKLSAFVGQ